MPMCSDGALIEGGVCPTCGGTNIRKIGDFAQCCADPYNKVKSCGYLGDESEFVNVQRKLL